MYLIDQNLLSFIVLISSIKSKFWQPYWSIAGNPEAWHVKVDTIKIKKLMIAIKDYEPRMKSDLVIKKGEIIEMIEDTESDWATGCRLEDNSYGNFPIEAFKVRFNRDEIVIINNLFRNSVKKKENIISKM